MSLISIVNQIKEAANSHAIIQSVAAGFAWDISAANVVYPQVFIEINPSPIYDKTITHKISLVISDRLQLGLENEIEAISNMIEIGLDLRQRLIDSGTNNQFNLTTYTPFTEGSTDLTAGVIMDFDVVEIDSKDRCNFPLK